MALEAHAQPCGIAAQQDALDQYGDATGEDDFVYGRARCRGHKAQLDLGTTHARVAGQLARDEALAQALDIAQAVAQ